MFLYKLKNGLGSVSLSKLKYLGSVQDGYLSSADWNTFNDKEDVLTFSTGLTRTLDTITTNDSEINHNNLLNTVYSFWRVLKLIIAKGFF